MATEFDLAQTFFIDKSSVLQSDTVFITSVDLFLEAKPVAGKTKTGIYKPGMSVYICPVENDLPKLDQASTEVARVEYDSINTSTTSTTATRFTFNYPVPVTSNRSYAFLIKLDGSDNDFALWWNRAGENILNTTSASSVSSGKVDGYFYMLTEGQVLTPMKDADLKFNINVARFSADTATFKLYNSNNEFFKYYANSISGNFKGGEYVWQNTASSTGTLNISKTSTSIVGTTTSFSSTLQVGDKFVITDGTVGNADVRTVVSIANNTSMVIDATPSFTNTAASYKITPVGTVYDFVAVAERMVLEDSTANSTVYFTSNATLYGVDSQASCKIESIIDYQANFVRPAYNITTPSGTYTNVSINVANSTFGKSAGNKVPAEIDVVTYISGYPASFASRSHEVLNGATLFEGSKSFEAEIVFTTTNRYCSPYAKQDNMDLYVSRYEVSNNYSGEYNATGNAISKYISKRVVLADGQDAEDLRVYLTAYKPANTDILVYAKMISNADPEPFDDKNWTKLELITDTNLLSSSSNRDDVKEFEYKIPYYQTGVAAAGLYTTALGNNVVVGVGATVNTEISVNDLVKIYQPTFPNNHIISIVTAANTSSITIADSVSNTSMVTTGLQIEKISEKNSGFINIQNGNVVRYYNSSYSAYDGYKNFAIKIVLLSDRDYIVPHVNNMRAIALSA